MTYLVLYIYLHYYHTGQYLQKEYSDGGGSVYYVIKRECIGTIATMATDGGVSMKEEKYLPAQGNSGKMRSCLIGRSLNNSKIWSWHCGTMA